MSLDNNIYHEIDRLRAQYQTNKILFISGLTIASLLKKLGSTDKELEEIKRMSDSLVGEPALEGIHSDGVDHTMTILFGHKNMKQQGSAITYLHSMAERSGIKLKEANKDHIISLHQHWDFLDTLMIVDHERKHSLSAVYQEDENVEATRDMLILFTHKPVAEGHVSFGYDSLAPHPDYPITFNMMENQRA